LLLIAPFIWALAIRRIEREAYSHLWLNRRLNRGPLIAIELVRIAIATVHVAFLMQLFYSPSVALVIAVLAMALATVIFSQKLQSFYDRIEQRFLGNLNGRENQKPVRPEITPWDAHLADFEIVPESSLSGKPLTELALREQYGVNIAYIERGRLSIVTPDRYEKLYPGDRISVIGTDEQLQRVKNILDASVLPPKDGADRENIGLLNYTITKNSPLYKKTIRESAIRENARALIVGVERQGERILNPDSFTALEEGDIIWIVGDMEKIQAFLKEA
jgi:CPA2 family monovalent cation:H+ antiporter-2